MRIKKYLDMCAQGLKRHGKLDTWEKTHLWSSDWRQTRGTNVCNFVNLQWQNNTWLTVKVPFLVLVSILNSFDFTFKPFEFATNILGKGPHSNTKMSLICLTTLSLASHQVKTCLWLEKWSAYRQKLFVGLGVCS